MIAETTAEPKGAGFEADAVQVIRPFTQTEIIVGVTNIYRTQ